MSKHLPITAMDKMNFKLEVAEPDENSKTLPIVQYGYYQTVSKSFPEEMKVMAKEMVSNEMKNLINLLDRLDDVHYIGDFEIFENKSGMMYHFQDVGFKGYFASESYKLFQAHFRCKLIHSPKPKSLKSVGKFIKEYIKYKTKKKYEWEKQ
jgi:hypothetical protein